jgi:transcriptional regulator with XRE-family HTH domain
MDEHAGRELGAFIRSRRDALQPSDVGLPEGMRRRSPGLRRSELASLAGISVDYLTRLEQGRDRNPSAQVLAALAAALQLDDDERLHLKKLSALAQSTELCPAAPSPASSIRPTVATLLEQLGATPALVLNRRSDLLGWNAAYDIIGHGVGILDDAEPNLARYTFGDRRAKTTYPDWNLVADDQVANLRATIQSCEDADERFIAELERLGGSEFRSRWDARPVATKRSGTKRIVHPQVGELRLDFETLVLPDADDQRLVAYLPADSLTASRLDDLQGRRPGALRSVVAARPA